MAPASDAPDPLARADRRMMRLALVLMAIIAGVGTVTYLGRILEPLLIALFLYYTISPAALCLSAGACRVG